MSRVPREKSQFYYQHVFIKWLSSWLHFQYD